MKKQTVVAVSALTALIVFHLLSNIMWLRQDNQPRGGDCQNHLATELMFADELRTVLSDPAKSIADRLLISFKMFNGSFDSIIPQEIYWPRFVFFTSSLYTWFFGTDIDVCRYSMFQYFILLIVSTYLLTKELSSAKPALLASFLVSFYPVFFTSSRQYGLDLPLAALFILSLYLLIKTDSLKKRKYCIFLGIALGIASLIKGQILLFVAFPLAYVLLHVILKLKKCAHKTNKFKGFNRIINFSIAIYTWLLLASFWWGNKIQQAAEHLPKHFTDAEKIIEGNCHAVKFSPDYLLWDLKAIFHSSVGPVFTILFIVILPFFVANLPVKTKPRRKPLLLLISFLGPFLFFTILCASKTERIMMPILPLMAVISSVSIYSVKKTVFKNILILFLSFLGLFQYFVLSVKDGYINIFNHKVRILTPNDYGGSPLYLDNTHITDIAHVITGIEPNTDNHIIPVGIVSERYTEFAHFKMLQVNPRIDLKDIRYEKEDFVKRSKSFHFMIIVTEQKNISWIDQQFIDASSEGLGLLEIFESQDNINKLDAAKSSYYLIKVFSDKTYNTYWHLYKNKNFE